MYKRLLQQIAEGNRVSFEQFYHEFYGLLASFLKKRFTDEHVVNDMMQEIFIAIWKGAKTYSEKSTVTAWVFSIARFKMMDKLREKYKCHEQLMDEEEEGAPDRDMALSKPDFSQELSDSLTMHDVLKKLPVESQELVSLVFLHGFSYKEIAEILSIPEGTVKSRIFHVKKVLKKELADWRYQQHADTM